MPFDEKTQKYFCIPMRDSGASRNVCECELDDFSFWPRRSIFMYESVDLRHVYFSRRKKKTQLTTISRPNLSVRKWRFVVVMLHSEPENLKCLMTAYDGSATILKSFSPSIKSTTNRFIWMTNNELQSHYSKSAQQTPRASHLSCRKLFIAACLRN